MILRIMVSFIYDYFIRKLQKNFQIANGHQENNSNFSYAFLNYLLTFEKQILHLRWVLWKKYIYWKHLLLDVNKVVIMLLLFSILLMIMTYKMSNVQKTPPRYNSTWSIYGSITHKQAAASSTREVYIRYSLKLCNQNPSMWVRVVNIYFILFI